MVAFRLDFFAGDEHLVRLVDVVLAGHGGTLSSVSDQEPHVHSGIL